MTFSHCIRHLLAKTIGADYLSVLLQPKTAVLPFSMENGTTLYRPLEKFSRSIRLLQNMPEPHILDDRLQCKLITRSLNESFRIEALSYTWDDPDAFDFKMLISVNGTRVPIRQNLLCDLRLCVAEEIENEKERGR